MGSVKRLYNADQLRVLRRQSEELEVRVRWTSACEDASPGAEDRSPLEDATKQHSKHHDWEHQSVCDSDL
jgi:hypothetical protein